MKRNLVLAIVPLSLALSAVKPAHAASLQKVEQNVWGVSGLPSYVNMYIYVPDKLATKPPILVASHHCQGTAMTTYNETKSGFVALADKNGFIMIFPEATGHNCWDVGSDKSLKHDGGGDTHAIAQMVRYTLSKYNADPGRVYAFGGSSGAMMTQALMGIYPELFMGGVAISGVPCGCWAASYSGDTATNGQWSGPCANGEVTKSAMQWGDQVRSMYQGYTGHRPRLQLWHGTSDTTISYKNLEESIKQWTNVLGLMQTPSTTDMKFGGTHQLWKSECGYGVFETFAITGATHAVSWDQNTATAFLGLDKVDSPDPETAACSPMGGAGGSGGGGASAGMAGSGGAGGTSAGNGGVAGGAGAAQGGSGAAGGTAQAGSAAGGTLNGGASGAGGVTTAGTSGASGASTSGGASSGGSVGGGGAPLATGGSVVMSSGGATASGGAITTPGSSGAGAGGANDSSEGCGCVVVGKSETRALSAPLAFALAALGFSRRRRLRVKREH